MTKKKPIDPSRLKPDQRLVCTDDDYLLPNLLTKGKVYLFDGPSPSHTMLWVICDDGTRRMFYPDRFKKETK